MSGGAGARMLPDGRRLHLNHGPIDLIVEGFGREREVRDALGRAQDCFGHILPALAGELDMLRRPAGPALWKPVGAVARRMAAAVWPHRQVFVTPMAAVAGAVSDHVLAAMTAGARLSRAYVNNGGDIAFHLTPGESLSAGVVGDCHLPAIDASARLGFAQPARGIATSGWKGRSHSLGIADAVTVLARDAAAADVAATLIANAVDIDHPTIRRMPASELDADSDLGERKATVAVGALDADSIAVALERGVAAAEVMQRAGHIHAAVLVLQGEMRVTEPALLAHRAA